MLMSKKTIPAVIGTTFVAGLALAPIANADENPFQMLEFGAAKVVAEGDAPAPKFTYGGGEPSSYGAEKYGTGKKDPAVCGSFSEAKCSIKYTEGK
jgi:hypothetical protein